ncbi:MAG: imidazoleglycerol-phosphate dehydratase [Spirochaetaceae bacterium]|nr:imidazoleglycerol-phosphate dehydratase [Spirochaetaceae bacterium]
MKILSASRIATVSRKTAETDITLTLNLDGTGKCSVECPIGFFNHMLSAFCKHGLFDLEGSLKGDLDVDQHHLIEDTGIVLGAAFDKALGNRAGIFRAGYFIYPMDESLCRAAVDFGGRSYLVCNARLKGLPLCCEATKLHAVTSFQTDTFEDFWQGFVSTAKCNLHLDTLRGRSDHHKMEGLFKAAAKAIRAAVAIDGRVPDQIPSTKAVLV